MGSVFSRFGYIDEKELFFSEVSGKGLYIQTREHILLPDNLQRDDPKYPVFQNISTKEKYFAKELRPALHNRAFARYAKTTVDESLILWPKDVIDIPPDNSIELSKLENEYDNWIAPEKSTNERKAVLFSDDYCVLGLSVRDHLDEIKARGKINYRNPEVLKLARMILTAFSKLNGENYLYLDFNLNRFHLTGYDYIYFDFSNLVYRIEDTENVDWTYENILVRPWIPLKFAEPAVVRGIWKYADLRTQNYSLTALMFYLLFGLCAYDGPLLEGCSEDSSFHFYEKFQKYHRNDIFIFDPDDKSNTYGHFSHEKALLSLWEEAPEQIKDVFVQALCTANAERTNDKDMNIGPDAWLEVFDSLGWK